MTRVHITGTGLFTPEESVSNEELVTAFNAYVENFNAEHAAEIEAGTVEALAPSSVEFIEKASGIKSRFVMNKSGIIDPEIMCPRLPERSNDEPSILAEMSMLATREAMQQSGIESTDIDAVLVACSNLQRPYPAIAVEVQELLGIDGFGFDMNVACSSATFGSRTPTCHRRCAPMREMGTPKRRAATCLRACCRRAPAAASSRSSGTRPKSLARVSAWKRKIQ